MNRKRQRGGPPRLPSVPQVESAVLARHSPSAILPVLNRINDGLDRIELASLMRTKRGERDVVRVLGYLEAPTYEDYLQRYRRRGIARRAVNLPITSSWDRRLMIEAVTEGDGEGDPAFRAAIDDILDRTKLLSAWIRLDRFLSFGRFAVLLLGIAGEEPLELPPAQQSSSDGLLYVTPYGERHISINTWDEDKASPRFGQPLTYKLRMDRIGQNGAMTSGPERIVHWQRCVHVSDDNVHSEIVGEPRMQAYLDDLDDIQKTTGGGAEMFWQGADRTIIAKAQADAELPDGAADDLRLAIEKMLNGLSRVIATEGVDVTALASSTPDPRGIYEVLIGNISAATGIPKRMFIGTERGELASSQDQENYAQTVEDRRASFNEPMVVRPTINRMMELGVVPAVDQYVCNWPAALVASQMQQAQIALTRAQALKTAAEALIAGGGVFEDEEVREAVGMARETGAIEPTAILNAADLEPAPVLLPVRSA